MFQMICYP